MRIQDITSENRSRERLRAQGVDVLSDAELLALILQKGSLGENVIDMSHRLLAKHGLEGLARCTLEELEEIPGIGRAKASQD